MSLATLKAAVVLYTNRPDLDTLTEQAVKAAVIKFHSSGYYAQDLLVATITLGAIASYQVVPYKTNYPRFRQVGYVKRVPTSGAVVPLTYIPPDQFFSHLQRDTFTVDNTNISVNSMAASNQLSVGIYQYPNLVLATGDSFIADEMPDLIVCEAAAIIFRSLNQKDKAEFFAQLAREQLNFLRQTKMNSVSVGK